MPAAPREDRPADGSTCTKVLILEDDEDLVYLLEELLKSNDFDVTTALNGVEGLHKIEAGAFNVVICDLMMPSMPGDVFYEEVRKIRPEMADRFIFLTGHSDNARLSEFIQRDDVRLLYKPVGVAELLRTVSSVLQS